MRAAEQLVAAHHDEVGAVGERSRSGTFGDTVGKVQRAAAEIVQDQSPAFSRQRRQLGDRDLLGEADEGEVRTVDAE